MNCVKLNEMNKIFKNALSLNGRNLKKNTSNFKSQCVEYFFCLNLNHMKAGKK